MCLILPILLNLKQQKKANEGNFNGVKKGGDRVDVPRLNKETNIFKKDAISDGITAAEKVAVNYLSQDETGIMIADLNDGPQTPSSATGRNVKIDNDSVDIRDGQDVLASFGETVTVGREDEAHMELRSDRLIGGSDDSPFIDFNSTGSSITDWYQQTLADDVVGNLIDYVGRYVIPFAVSSATFVVTFVVNVSQRGVCTFTYGTAESKEVTVNGVRFAVRYDGDYLIRWEIMQATTIDYSKSVVATFRADYTILGPCFSFGSGIASGPFATAFGRGTAAGSMAQLTFGKYNQEDLDDTFALIGGGGNNAGAPVNILALDWAGDLHIKGNLYTGSANDSSGGVMIGAIEYTSDVSDFLDVGTQATVINAQCIKYGKLCQLYINWRNNSAITVPANGNIANVLAGTLKSGYRPRAAYTAAPSIGDGAGQAMHHIAASGAVNLSSCEATGVEHTIAAGSNFYVCALYILP